MAKGKYTRKRFRSLLSSLERKYGRKHPQHTDAPLQNLLLVVVSPGLSEGASRKAIRNLRAKYVDWNQVRVGQTFAVREAMSLSLDRDKAHEKAKRVLACIADVFRAHGNLDLEPLKDAKSAEQKRFLGGLECLDKHEINAVLVTAFQRPVVAMDVGVLRVCRRIGLVSENMTRAVAQKSVEGLLADSEHYGFYWLMREHALRYCTLEEPRCKNCPVRSRCPVRDQF